MSFAKYRGVSGLKETTFYSSSAPLASDYLNLNIIKLGVTFFNSDNISQKPNIKHRHSIPLNQGLVTPDVFSRVSLKSRSDLTSKNGLEISKILGCSMNLPDALHIYLVNHLIKNES